MPFSSAPLRASSTSLLALTAAASARNWAAVPSGCGRQLLCRCTSMSRQAQTANRHCRGCSSRSADQTVCLTAEFAPSDSLAKRILNDAGIGAFNAAKPPHFISFPWPQTVRNAPANLRSRKQMLAAGQHQAFRRQYVAAPVSVVNWPNPARAWRPGLSIRSSSFGTFINLQAEVSTMPCRRPARQDQETAAAEWNALALPDVARAWPALDRQLAARLWTDWHDMAKHR